MEIPNKRVVIFDDEEDILSICTLILEERGFEVITFLDCDGIVEKIASLVPAVILMDNKIPDIGGIEATRLLKNSGLNGIPVIYFSANTDIETLAKSAGADTFLAKPFDLEELESVILSVLK